jgi:hypothetical protein
MADKLASKSFVENRTPYSVRDFGALATPEADDTQAIQDAIDYVRAQGGGTIYFPKGTYRHGYLQLDGAVHLQGTNGTVFKAIGYSGVAQGKATNVVIAVGARTTSESNVFSGSIEGIEFRTEIALPNTAMFINVFAARRYRICYNKFIALHCTPIKHNNDGSYYAGWPYRTDCWIIGNFIDNEQTDNLEYAEGISVAGVTPDTRAQRYWILNNTIIGVSDDPIASHGVDGLWIEGNYCESLDGTIKVTDSINFRVVGNSVRHLAFGGVALIWTAWESPFPPYLGTQKGLIADNRLIIQAGQNVGSAINVHGGTDIAIRGNTVRNESSNPTYIYVGQESFPEQPPGTVPAQGYGRIIIEDNELLSCGIHVDETLTGTAGRDSWVKVAGNRYSVLGVQAGINWTGTNFYAGDYLDLGDWTSTSHTIDGRYFGETQVLAEFGISPVPAGGGGLFYNIPRLGELLHYYAPADVFITAFTVEIDALSGGFLSSASMQIIIHWSSGSTTTFSPTSSQFVLLYRHTVTPAKLLTKHQFFRVEVMPEAELTGATLVVRAYGQRVGRMA